MALLFDKVVLIRLDARVWRDLDLMSNAHVLAIISQANEYNHTPDNGPAAARHVIVVVPSTAV